MDHSFSQKVDQAKPDLEPQLEFSCSRKDMLTKSLNLSQINNLTDLSSYTVIKGSLKELEGQSLIQASKEIVDDTLFAIHFFVSLCVVLFITFVCLRKKFNFCLTRH